MIELVSIVATPSRSFLDTMLFIEAADGSLIMNVTVVSVST
jgi:hypothetical protein